MYKKRQFHKRQQHCKEIPKWKKKHGIMWLTQTYPPSIFHAIMWEKKNLKKGKNIIRSINDYTYTDQFTTAYINSTDGTVSKEKTKITDPSTVWINNQDPQNMVRLGQPNYNW